MSDTANFFARALGRAPVAPQQPQQLPPQYVQPQAYPTQQAPVQPMQQAPAGPPVVGVDAAGNPIVTVMGAAANWQGTRQAKADTGVCPQCGSERFFLRQSVKMKRINASPSPICFDCGYNEIFEGQFGEITPVDSKAPVAGTSARVDTWVPPQGGQ